MSKINIGGGNRDFSKGIQEFRQKEGMTQFDLSKLVGKNPSYIGHIENNKIKLTLDFLMETRDLGLDVNKLITNGKSSIIITNNPYELQITGSSNNSKTYDLCMNNNTDSIAGLGFQSFFTQLNGESEIKERIIIGSKFIIPLNGNLTVKVLSSESSSKKPVWNYFEVSLGEAFLIYGGQLHGIINSNLSEVEFLEVSNDPRGRLGVINPFLLKGNENYNGLFSGFLPKLNLLISSSNLTNQEIANKCKTRFSAINITKKVIDDIKSYKTNVKIDVIFCILSVLGKEICDIMGSAVRYREINLNNDSSMKFPDSHNEILYRKLENKDTISLDPDNKNTFVYVKSGYIKCKNLHTEEIKLFEPGNSFVVNKNTHVVLSSIVESELFTVT